MDTPQLLDSIQLALRNNGAGPALELLKLHLGALSSANDKEATQAFFQDVIEIAHWERQCGANPLDIYTFLIFLYKRTGETTLLKKCTQLITCYERMQSSGVAINNMESCRKYIEQNQWTHHPSLSVEGRESFESSIGYWRQMRLLSSYDVLLENFLGASWLTIGDGYHATETRYINARGGHATASNITGVVLEQTVQAGLINEFRVEDVEHLSCADESYDFVAGKDMLHHASRPWTGIYEMLRVAREGVCFIEPFDYSHGHLSFTQKSPFTTEQKHPAAWHGFEEGVGNYIYSFSDRDVAKLCMGMGLPLLACKGFCDYYSKDLDGLPAEENSPALGKIRGMIETQEQRAQRDEAYFHLVAYIILKKPPTRSFLADLAHKGFTLVDLPRNPYLEDAFLTHG